MRRLIIASLALIACGGAAPATQTDTTGQTTDEARIARALTGLTPGKAVDCISQIRPGYSTESIGDVILYKVNRRLIYRNNTSGGCSASPGLNTLIVRNYGMQLCRGTIVATVDPQNGVGTGGCSLGSFVPYTKPK